MLIDQTILFYLNIILFFILIIWVVRLEIKLRKVLLGKDAKTLEDSIEFTGKEIKHLKEFEKNSISYFENVEKRLNRSIQSIETIRFNPFKGIGEGGNQSFTTSFINEKGDGVILSSLYSRDRISVFSKPVLKFKSQFELTEEENAVLSKAQKSL